MECFNAFSNSFKSLLGIGLFYAFSMSLIFFNNNIIKAYPFPLSITFFHLLMKFIFACIVRSIISLYRGEKRVEIPWSSYIRDVSPTGIASALDIGLSNWSFEFITVSLYTMTKSTTIIFVLLFAIICKLEKPSTQFDGIGFILVLSASAVSGIRWTAAQKLTQKSKFGLGNPVDVIYHTQPWMALTLLPLSFYFEIMELLTSPLLFRTQVYLPLFRTLGLFMCGALLAFGLECSEIFVVCHASSLTLAIAGIFKEVITLYLAAAINGDVSNPVNKVGLIICLTGISIHIGLKFIKSFSYRRHRLRFLHAYRWHRTSSVYEKPW
uniref:Solute carrier family 35 member C2 n=2 Tax=Schistocephalus solidus TaxID=70667 RepID=A0A0X3NR88_SCHSO